MSKITVGFHYGALADPYEKQAREHGYTLGDKAELMNKLGFGLTINHIHGTLSDSAYDKALQKLQKKLIENLKRSYEVQYDSKETGHE